MTFWIADWLRAFALTLALEIAVATPLLRAAESRGFRRTAGIVFANLATHPIVWFVFPGAALAHAARVALSELWAVAAEAAVYRLIWPQLPFRRCIGASLCANAVSALVGYALQTYG